METMLKKLFDYQAFEQEPTLQKVIDWHPAMEETPGERRAGGGDVIPPYILTPCNWLAISVYRLIQRRSSDSSVGRWPEHQNILLNKDIG